MATPKGPKAYHAFMKTARARMSEAKAKAAWKAHKKASAKTAPKAAKRGAKKAAKRPAKKAARKPTAKAMLAHVRKTLHAHLVDLAHKHHGVPVAMSRRFAKMAMSHIDNLLRQVVRAHKDHTAHLTEKRVEAARLKGEKRVHELALKHAAPALKRIADENKARTLAQLKARAPQHVMAFGRKVATSKRH